MGVSVSPGKRFVKRWSRRLFSLTGRILGRSGITPGVRILTYHRIENDPADPFALSPTDFIHQMEILVSSGALVSLTDSLQHLTCRRSPIPRIVVTFDDGTSDFLHNAFPVLSRLMIPATLYVNPSRVGMVGFLNWGDLRQLFRAGVSIESHGLEHLSLGGLPRPAVLREVADSRRILEDRLGHAVTSFAYPFGTVRDFNAEVKEIVRDAGYRTACASINGINREGSDLLELRRTKIEQSDDPIFPWLLAGCMDGWAFFDRHLSGIQNRYR